MLQGSIHRTQWHKNSTKIGINLGKKRTQIQNKNEKFFFNPTAHWLKKFELSPILDRW